MPGETEHLHQAAHNARFLSTIDRVSFPDWAVTAIFYTALHYIDAFLARKGIVDPADHENREKWGKSFVELQRVMPPYRRIKDASIRTRYYGYRPRPEEIEKLIHAPLAHIRNHIGQLLDKDLTMSPLNEPTQAAPGVTKPAKGCE